MNNGPAVLWCYWLKGTLIIMAVFSTATVVFPQLTHSLFDWIAFAGERPEVLSGPEAAGYLTFVYGVLGAVMLGWSALLYYIVRGPFQRGERWAWYAIAVPVTLWFVVDSVHSVVTGYWPNALFNGGFYVAFGIPLIATFASFGDNGNSG